MNIEKNLIRQKVKDLKKLRSREELKQNSEIIFRQIEELQVFQEAKIILLYWSMFGEVFTHDFIEKWCNQKTILLPVALDEELELRLFTSKQNMKKSLKMNLLEPIGDAYFDFSKIDLAIIPGVAFDEDNNRLGYGKGYYDKLLSKLSVYKIGICNNFQFFKNIPFDVYDIKMDLLIKDS